MAEGPPNSRAVWVPWLLIPATEVWLHLAAATPPAWAALGAEVLVFLWLGLTLPRLPSWPVLGHPVWALVAPVLAVAVAASPADLRALPYLVGVGFAVVAPALWLARRVWMPWWGAAGAVPVLVVALHLVRALGSDATDATAWADRARDLAGPLRWSAAPPSQATGPAVVIISVDTLRADSAQQMATFERLAAGGASWATAMSTSSWTLPALSSLQTGLMPGEHGAGCLAASHCQGLDPDVETLAERLHEAGYATVGISANPWAGRNNGLERGFDRFFDLGTDPRRPLLLLGEALMGPHPQDAEVVIDLALEELDRLDGGFYLWVHLIDPHLPYVHAADPRLQGLTVEQLRNADVLSPSRRDEIRAAYEGEVAHADTQLSRLVDALQARGILDTGIVVFTSDHGEEFWEHGGVEHGHSHHAEVVEVPLVLRAPGIAAGPRRGVASLQDVAGTVLATLGLGQPPVDLRRPLPPGRIATAQGNLHVQLDCSARDDATRVIAHGCGEGPVDAWDLSTDPEELRPRDPDPNDPVRRAADAVTVPDLRDAARQNTDALRALGYME